MLYLRRERLLLLPKLISMPMEKKGKKKTVMNTKKEEEEGNEEKSGITHTFSQCIMMMCAGHQQEPL